MEAEGRAVTLLIVLSCGPVIGMLFLVLSPDFIFGLLGCVTAEIMAFLIVLVATYNVTDKMSSIDETIEKGWPIGPIRDDTEYVIAWETIVDPTKPKVKYCSNCGVELD